MRMAILMAFFVLLLTGCETTFGPGWSDLKSPGGDISYWAGRRLINGSPQPCPNQIVLLPTIKGLDNYTRKTWYGGNIDLKGQAAQNINGRLTLAQSKNTSVDLGGIEKTSVDIKSVFPCIDSSSAIVNDVAIVKNFNVKLDETWAAKLQAEGSLEGLKNSLSENAKATLGGNIHWSGGSTIGQVGSNIAIAVRAGTWSQDTEKSLDGNFNQSNTSKLKATYQISFSNPDYNDDQLKQQGIPEIVNKNPSAYRFCTQGVIRDISKPADYGQVFFYCPRNSNILGIDDLRGYRQNNETQKRKQGLFLVYSSFRGNEGATFLLIDLDRLYFKFTNDQDNYIDLESVHGQYSAKIQDWDVDWIDVD